MGRPPGRKNLPKQANGAATTSPKAARKQAAPAAPSAMPAEKKANQPTPEERAGWLAELTTLETAKQRIAGDTSALAQRVKAKGGVKAWKSLKAVHSYKKLDRDEAIALLEDLVVAAAQVDIRISWMGNQATFADIMEQPAAQSAPIASIGAESLAVARAHSDGYNSGKRGAVPSDNPHAHKPGSAEYVAWHNGRDDGDSDRQKTKPAEASRLKDALAADATLPGEQASSPSADPLF